MADFTITLTVPDAKVTELVAALNWKFNHEAAPLNAAQLRAEYKTVIVADLKGIFFAHKEYLRNQTPVPDSDIAVT